MKTFDQVQRQLNHLYKAQRYWSQQAEEAIKRQDFTSMAACNADQLQRMCWTLEWVLRDRAIPPVFYDNGNPYSLEPEK